MTRAPHRPPLAYRDIDDIARALRDAGGRFSAARRRVLEALFAADAPLPADAVAPGLDRASVYRALEYLEELGVVRHVHLGHSPGLYALTGGTEREYLACERCARVVGVEAEQLDEVRATIEREFGYVARFSHFPIVGLCADCAAVSSEDMPRQS
jgi:Fur family transcriptional regulator, ferric uptake regulator